MVLHDGYGFQTSHLTASNCCISSSIHLQVLKAAPDDDEGKAGSWCPGTAGGTFTGEACSLIVGTHLALKSCTVRLMEVGSGSWEEPAGGGLLCPTCSQSKNSLRRKVGKVRTPNIRPFSNKSILEIWGHCVYVWHFFLGWCTACLFDFFVLANSGIFEWQDNDERIAICQYSRAVRAVSEEWENFWFGEYWNEQIPVSGWVEFSCASETYTEIHIYLLAELWSQVTSSQQL